jgi:hypothetical protein
VTGGVGAESARGLRVASVESDASFLEQTFAEARESASGAQAPRSGVAGLLPFDLRQKLIINGWGVLPIGAHDCAGKSAGKAPSIRGWQHFAQFGGNLPSEVDLREWGRRTLGAPGTGLPTGNIVAIDVDVSDPVTVDDIQAIAFEELGATPFIRQGRAPRIALIYRAAEAIGSVSLKVLHGTGDGLDILANGRQLVGYGVHPGTCRCYEWIGPEQPLTSRPDAAPSITGAQVGCFLERVGKILPLSKTGGRRGTQNRKAGEGAEIVRNAAGLVTDGREGWLTRKVHQAGLEMYVAGEKPTVSALMERSWKSFAASACLKDGRWQPSDAEGKARAWLDRVRRKLIPLGAKIVSTEPTYPDERLSLVEAEYRVGEVISSFFDQHVPAWRAQVEEYRLYSKQLASR